MSTFFDWLLRLPAWFGPAVLTLGFFALLARSRLATERISRLLGPPDDAEPTESLQRALDAEEVYFPGSPVPRRVLRRPLEAIVREFAEDHLDRSWSLSNSHVLTGVALLFTFLLIAIVLSQKVSGAISNSEDTSALADAVGALGKKFFISATGVALAILHGAFASQYRLRIVHLATARARALASSYESFETYRTRLDIEQNQEVKNALADVAATLHGILQSQQGLKSIEVSVKNIGAEVEASLRQMVTQQIAEEMRNVLNDALGELADTLGGRFASMTSEALAGIQSSMEKIRVSVESQGGSQLEQLLGQLRDSVSGGFHSEAAQMSVALRQFGEVVPALEHQLRALVDGLTTDMRSHQDAGAKTQEAMFTRLDTVLGALTAQQDATRSAIEQITHASRQGADEVATRMQQAGSDAVAAMFRASSTEVGNVVQRLQAAAVHQGDLGVQVAETARSIEHARSGLQDCASVIQQLGVQTRAVVDGLRLAAQEVLQSQKGATVANERLEAVSTGLRGAAEAAQQQIAEQTRLLTQQATVTRELERVWPQLFETYIARFKQTSDQLATSWDELYTRVNSLTNSASSDLSSSAQELVDAIQEHKRDSATRPANAR